MYDDYWDDCSDEDKDDEDDQVTVYLEINMVYSPNAARSMRNKSRANCVRAVRELLSDLGIQQPPNSSVVFDGDATVTFGWHVWLSNRALIDSVCKKINGMDVDGLREHTLDSLTFCIKSEARLSYSQLPCGFNGGCTIPAPRPAVRAARASVPSFRDMAAPVSAASSSRNIPPSAPMSSPSPSIFARPAPPPLNTPATSLNTPSTPLKATNTTSIPVRKIIPTSGPSPSTTSGTGTRARTRSVSTVPDLDEADVAALFRQTLPRAHPAELPSPVLRATELGAAPPPLQPAKARPRPMHVEWNVPHPPSVPSTPMRDVSPMSTASWGCPDPAPVPPPLAKPPAPVVARPRAPAKPLSAIPPNVYAGAVVGDAPSSSAKNSQGQTGKAAPASFFKPVIGSTRPVASARPAAGAATETRGDPRRSVAERAAPPSCQPQQRVPSTKRKQPEDEASGSVISTNASTASERAKRARTSMEQAGSSKARGPEDPIDVDMDAPVGNPYVAQPVAAVQARPVIAEDGGRVRTQPVMAQLERVQQPAQARVQATSTSAGASKALPPPLSTSGASQPPARPQASLTATAPGGASKAQSSSTMSVPKPLVRPEEPVASISAATFGASQPPARPQSCGTSTVSKAQSSSTASASKPPVRPEEPAAARIQATSTSAGASKAPTPTLSTSEASQPPARPQASAAATVLGGASNAQPSSTMSVPKPSLRPEDYAITDPDIATLLWQNADTELQLLTAHKKLSTQTAELEQARLAAADEATRRAASERDVETLRKEFEQERVARAKVEADAAALQKRQLALLNAERAAREEGGKLRADLEASRACVAAVEAELKQQRVSVNAADDALKAALMDAKSAKDELRCISDTLQRERKASAQTVNDKTWAEAELECVKTQLVELSGCTRYAADKAREDAEKLRVDLEAERARAAAVEGELEQQRTRAAVAEGALKTSQTDAKDAKDALDALQRDRARAKAELERVETQLGELSRSHDSLTSEHAQLQQELANMKTVLEEAENARSRAEAKNHELLAARKQLEEQCATHEQVIAQMEAKLREEAEHAASELARANEAYGELSEDRIRDATTAEERERDLERQLREAHNECETVRRGFQEHVATLEADLASKTRGVSEEDMARLSHLDALKRQNFNLVAKLEDIAMENRAHAHSLKAVWDAGQALLALADVVPSDSELRPEPTPPGAYGDLEAMMRQLSAIKKLQPEYNNMRATLDKAKGSLAEERRAKEQLREAARQERAAVKDATERCHKAELVALEERKRRQEAEQEAAEERKRRADVELVVHEVGHAATIAALVKM